jgi:PhoH-like ATPase
MNDGHIKHFVVDTNVLLHNPNALFMFADNEVIIPFDVIEELDKFKT